MKTLLIVMMIVFAAGSFAYVSLPSRAALFSANTWQQMASPGHLSSAHAGLEQNCGACHTSSAGIDTAKCVLCHSNNQAILKRQPTAFHGHINSCKECHLEHQGSTRQTTVMDHTALARVGLRQLKLSDDNDSAAFAGHAEEWIRNSRSSRTNPNVTSSEAVLNCVECHSNKDIHVDYFGKDCSTCHSTAKWNIAEFRHPSSLSIDCNQCHRPPPSHYMMHFKMISMTVAKQPHADVSQCFLCHQTTSWNDIKGVGWYKHH